MTMNNDTYRLNKLQHTKVGDNIDYFVNGVQKSGTVVKMNGGYITVFKDDRYNTIKVDDTFFVKDIIAKQKSWNDMTMGERGEVLVAIKAYSPRYLQKTWEQLPRELQSVLKEGAPVKFKINPLDDRDDEKVDKLTQNRSGQSAIASSHSNLGENEPDSIAGEKKSKEHDIPKYLEGKTPLGKSDVEQGAYGNVGGRPFMGVSTQFDMDADKDYEGATHTDFKEQFKHENKKPEVTHEGHDTKKDADGSMTTADGVNPVANNKKEKRRY